MDFIGFVVGPVLRVRSSDHMDRALAGTQRKVTSGEIRFRSFAMWDIILTSCIILFVYFATGILMQNYWRRQAILHGAARYVTDKNGRPQFRWQDEPDPADVPESQQ